MQLTSVPVLVLLDLGPWWEWPKSVRKPQERERFILGVCTRCGKEPLVSGKSGYGENCMQKIRNVANQRHADLLEIGMCKQCGREPHVRWGLCLVCSQEHSRYRTEYGRRKAAQ